MKLRQLLLKGLLFFVFVGVVSVPSFAQLGDVGSILQSGKEDANTLVRAYLEPFGSGFGAGLNTGWTNTAKTHNTLGFDLTVSAGLAIVPDEDLTFDVTQLDLQELELEDGSPITPTISGPSETGPTMAAYANVPFQGREKLVEFNMPEGTGFEYSPAPMIKAGIGLIKNTDVMVRYTPEYNIEDYGSFKLFGVGVKHDVKQWLPGGKLIPVDISVMFGYTNMELGTDFDVMPNDVITQPEDTENPYPASTWDGQRAALTTDAWTVNALVGKTLPVISVYGGIGYEASTFSVSTPGSYPTVIPNEEYQTDPNNNEPLIVNAIEKPINVEMEGQNGFRALAGFRLRFAIFHVSASYTLANYSSYNVGFGISFR
ncbi:hypothetical protein NC796_08060 [Aliifodinibius sp. S!AR15-10]|uniref:DUF6588 family protein n=1 Tax=Aliifodinibius sp. S!AR15-10 TaxID=2950437 RepID=UPI002855F1F5|nr:DUF6588 family protein [Aliifodinibius sp. S!AR15-10]MDR8391087.1 hypothetical protein [Aliifodinibius sp. S!AR15-10]